MNQLDLHGFSEAAAFGRDAATTLEWSPVTTAAKAGGLLGARLGAKQVTGSTSGAMPEVVRLLGQAGSERPVQIAYLASTIEMFFAYCWASTPVVPFGVIHFTRESEDGKWAVVD